MRTQRERADEDDALPNVASQKPSTGIKHFRPDIEGLRAVAVLAVVLFHADVPGLSGGFIGVDVFFVISGFLITGLLWREAGTTGSVSLRRFWGARARRLLPASATVGVVTVIVSLFLLPPLQIRTVGIDAITSALYVSNYWFAFTGINYFGKDDLLSPSPFQHYWSLGVEEQFYLFWPLLIIASGWLLSRRRRRSEPADGKSDPADGASSERPYLLILALVAIVSFGLSWVITYIFPPVAYFSLPTRAWQLAVGGIVALTVAYWRELPLRLASTLGWAGLAMITIACFTLSSSTDYPGTAALLPTLGAAMVIAGGCAGTSRGCGRLLGLSPMRAIGRISYSWYLWHWPVLVFAPLLLGPDLSLGARLAAALFAAGLAALTLRYIENPLRFSTALRDSPSASLKVGAAATAVAVAVGVVPLVIAPTPVGRGPASEGILLSVDSAPQGSSLQNLDAAVRRVFDQVNAAVAASVGIEAVPSNLTPPLTGQTDQFKAIMTGGCLRLPLQGDQPECAVGDVASQTSVALIGDSRAAMFNPAFEAVADQRGWRLEMMSKAACPIVELPLTNKFNSLAESFQRCAQWRSQVMARLRDEPPQLVVISIARGYGANGTGIWKPAGFEFFDTAWIAGLNATVRQLRATGAQVLVLGPTPDPATSVPDCLAAHLEDAKACAAPQDQRPLSRSGMAAEAGAVESAGGQYADIVELFCAEGTCPAIVGDTMVYFDAGHITREYARFLAPAMGALADRALAETSNTPTGRK